MSDPNYLHFSGLFGEPTVEAIPDGTFLHTFAVNTDDPMIASFTVDATEDGLKWMEEVRAIAEREAMIDQVVETLTCRLAVPESGFATADEFGDVVVAALVGGGFRRVE